MPYPLLTTVLVTPLVGAFVILCVASGSARAIKAIASVFGVLGVFVSLPLWFRFNLQDSGWQFVERARWLPAIGAEYFLGVDGFSALLVLLTAIVTATVVVASWSDVTEHVKQYYATMLVLETGILGALLSLDGLLFFVMCEVMLVAAYMLVTKGNTPERATSLKLLLLMATASAAMLAGLIALYVHHRGLTGESSFDLTKFQALPIPPGMQMWIFAAFFVAFAVMLPLVSFQSWLADGGARVPRGAPIMLPAGLLTLGTYGFVRINLPVLPDATRAFAPIGGILSIAAILGGAVWAMRQDGWKRALGFTSASQLGLVTLGLFTLTPAGLTGSLLQQINIAISLTALLLLAGIAIRRRHEQEISAFGGLWKTMPVYAALLLIATLSFVGFPLLNGFAGMSRIVQGAFAGHKVWAAAAVGGVALSAIYMLRIYQRVVLGQSAGAEQLTGRDVGLREAASVAPMMALAVWIGVFPTPFLSRLQLPVTRVVARVNPPPLPEGLIGPDCAAPAEATPAPPEFSNPGGGAPPVPFLEPPCADETVTPAAEPGAKEKR